ncbi:MAG: hypothetical protein R6V62_08320 [Candidatus Fermentibacteraceae bacterium]
MKYTLLPAFFVLLASGCDSTGPLALLWARFRVENTQSVSICGIPVDDLDNLSLEQAATVLSYWLQGQCPVDMTVGLGVKNPNISSQWLAALPLTLARLDYDVFLDTDDGPGVTNTQVATGLFTGEFGIPESGEVVVLGLGLGFDAFELMEVLGPEEVIGLILAIGGISGDVRDSDHLGRVSMFVVPEVQSPFGSMVWEEGFWVGLDWTSGDKP